MTCIDTFLDAVTGGDGIPTDIYAECALLDATVTSWRFQARGPEAIATTYGRWFAAKGELEELDRYPIEGGEVVRYLLTWMENGIPHAAHHIHVLETDRSDRIMRDTVFCGGRWAAGLLAQMADADR